MRKDNLPGRILSLDAYTPGLSIDEIRQKYNLANVIKLASNENPLGSSPLAREAIAKNAALAFRYPRAGNPALREALARRHAVEPGRIAIGNGSEEIIDLLMRLVAEPGKHTVACFRPCFGIYPVQAKITGLEVRHAPLNGDFSFNFDALLGLVDRTTRLCFLTTPDNPSGYCPAAREVEEFARKLGEAAPECLLVLDEAYMDFAPDWKCRSLLELGGLPANAAVLRTFSKSFGLAGLRIGYGVLPEGLGEYYWRARLPFSLNILAEEAALAALTDEAFHEKTLETVAVGREYLASGLSALGCKVWPSAANFLMFQLPAGAVGAPECFERLLARGIIIRKLNSYNLPEHLRVSVGNSRENRAFLEALGEILQSAPTRGPRLAEKR